MLRHRLAHLISFLSSVFSDLMEGFGIRPGTPTSVIDYGFIYGGTSDDEERADLLRRCHNALNCTIMHELDEAAVKKLWGKEVSVCVLPSSVAGNTLMIHCCVTIQTVYPDEDAVGPFRAVKHAAYPLPSAVHLTDDVLCRVCHAKQLPCAAHAPVYCDHADPEVCVLLPAMMVSPSATASITIGIWVFVFFVDAGGPSLLWQWPREAH